ncbi:ABC transporter permease [Spirochaeta isovalerica]|uniref:Simple sugar transport system permease protein n=1 Tax=Spirochaeta isovalerica TaxID=150 RepID=A0A841RG46_9SPIO|nr:ABC transporter permease [Spirochaeta isovalerica]MBB6482187.1 simple sugar transport system permease protein [Spirochaeta isovalerica]
MIGKTLIFMVPLLIAAMGGLITELAGVLNIALEGMILAGAFAAVLAVDLTGSLTAGFIAAMAVSGLLAVLFSFTSLKLKGNIFVTGLAINLITPPLIAMVSKLFYGSGGVIRLTADSLHLTTASAAVWVLFFTGSIWAILKYTPLGLHIRTAGTDPDFLFSRGIRPERIQSLVIIASGLLCGLSGAIISLKLGVFIPGISAGKGWIALVAVYLGFKKPFPVLLACFIFALAESLSDSAQGIIEIPANLILSFPYFITITGLVLFSIIKNRQK